MTCGFGFITFLKTIDPLIYCHFWTAGFWFHQKIRQCDPTSLKDIDLFFSFFYNSFSLIKFSFFLINHQWIIGFRSDPFKFKQTHSLRSRANDWAAPRVTCYLLRFPHRRPPLTAEQIHRRPPLTAASRFLLFCPFHLSSFLSVYIVCLFTASCIATAFYWLLKQREKGDSVYSHRCCSTFRFNSCFYIRVLFYVRDSILLLLGIV